MILNQDTAQISDNYSVIFDPLDKYQPNEIITFEQNKVLKTNKGFSLPIDLKQRVLGKCFVADSYPQGLVIQALPIAIAHLYLPLVAHARKLHWSLELMPCEECLELARQDKRFTSGTIQIISSPSIHSNRNVSLSSTPFRYDHFGKLNRDDRWLFTGSYSMTVPTENIYKFSVYSGIRKVRLLSWAISAT